jgi:hypothetical protein
MMKKLRGRNLSHPGCLIGITVGLSLGIVLAAILAALNVALTTDFLLWFSLTIALGAIGWIVGNRLTTRFPTLDEQTTLKQTTSKSTSD